MYENEETRERALLVSLDTGEYDAEASLRELCELTESAGADPAFTLMQKRPAPDSATCIGSGMAKEAAELIEREKLDNLFDRFYRADPSRSSQSGGYGIGLSIAKAAAEAHGGTIAAASEDGNSLTVTVTLPLGHQR